ncbi:MAG: hypothetical protein ACOYMZ_02525 [Minisyncoccia bacterium]
MDPNKSLEQLLSAKPEDILKQLLAFNLMIQKSGNEEIIAIWHTLKSAESMANASTTGSENIQELLKSVKSRLKIILAEEHSVYRKEKKELFESIVGEL